MRSGPQEQIDYKQNHGEKKAGSCPQKQIDYKQNHGEKKAGAEAEA